MGKVSFSRGLAACILLLAGTEVVHAAKLMAFARWAARETVKAALVEYATHEVGESFEAFRQKFCVDKTYRQKVLSSPAISPLIAGQSSAEELIVETLGCGYNLGKVNVVFTDVVPGNFQSGRAQSCQVKATAYNYSKYHLDNLVVDLGGWKVAVGDLVANAYGDIELPSFDLSERGKCSNSGQWLNEHVKEAGALQCSMPGMAEGDCQELISVSSAIDVEKIRAVEEKALQEGAAKRTAELERLRRNNLKVGEEFIYWDSQHQWLDLSPSIKAAGVSHDLIRGCSVTVTDVHRDKDGIDDFYNVILECPTITRFNPTRDLIGWTEAANFKTVFKVKERSSARPQSNAEANGKKLTELRRRTQAIEKENNRTIACRDQWTAFSRAGDSCMKQAIGVHNIQWYNECVQTNAPLSDDCKNPPYPLPR
jgi:hypothetical protein